MIIPAVLLTILLVVVVVAGISRNVRGRGPSGSISVSQALRTPLTPETRDRALELVRQGQKITAIKELRIATGYGLREAKVVVDALQAGNRPH